MVHMTYENANRYCSFKGGRLPTVAEWLYAATDGKMGDYIENGFPYLDYGWFRDNSNGRFHSVGEKKPNNFGLYDMLGNAWELTSDGVGPSGTVRAFSALSHSKANVNFISKGGCCKTKVSSFSILSSESQGVDEEYADNEIGFRCVY